MSGNKQGGLKAKQTNIERHGADFYKKIGSIGGKIGTTGGFYANRELARIAGKKGGQISKRKKQS
jgi:general stress protein YciG